MRRKASKARLRVGANIRRLRRLQGWSQEALAERIGMSEKEVGRIERGETNASVDLLAAVAAALGSDICDLLRGGSNDGTGAATYLIREADLTHLEDGLRIVERVRRGGRLSIRME
jgi:transcriptional regulator with XRE-family HTH domain